MAARVGLPASLTPCVPSPLLPQMYEKYNTVLRFFSGKARYTVEEQAHHYAAGKASTVFEMRMGLIDRGAELSLIHI